MSRHDTAAQGTPYHRPMTDVRRREVFGPLRTMADDARDAGEPPLAIGVLFLGLCLAAIAMFFIVIEPPVASDASPTPPAASFSPAHGAVEAGAMGNRGQGK